MCFFPIVGAKTSFKSFVSLHCGLYIAQLTARRCQECGQTLPPTYQPPADEDWSTGIFGCAEDPESWTKLLFRSTRDGGNKNHKNLYIMDDAQAGEYGDGTITRLTNGPWTDTQCKWDPRGDWIVFSSTRDKPIDAPENDNKLDLGYFAVFLVKWNDPSVVVKVMGSASDLAGHVNHPFFSPDGKTIVVSSDLAAVSVDPISLPLIEHSVRSYGDIFTFDFDRDDINKNKDVKKFNRITHSRYENSTRTWTMFSTQDPNAAWNLFFNEAGAYTPSCPYAYGDGGESWHMKDHFCIPK